MGNQNVKVVFSYIFVKSGSIYVKPRPNWSPAHSADIVRYISTMDVSFCVGLQILTINLMINR